MTDIEDTKTPVVDATIVTVSSKTDNLPEEKPEETSEEKQEVKPEETSEEKQEVKPEETSEEKQEEKTESIPQATPYKMPEASLITELSKATNMPEAAITAELNKAVNPPTEDVAGDPSIAKMKNLQKLSSDPPKLPGLDVLTIEPKATIAASKVIDMLLTSLSNPQLTRNIIDNINKSVELSLENKINKIEYLKNDTKHLKDNKDTSTIINNIHNETMTNRPIQVALKGGIKPFFTEEECSFF
jgi:hypothetical protein